MARLVGLEGQPVLGSRGRHPAEQPDHEADHAGRQHPAAEDEAEEEDPRPNGRRERQERRARDMHAGRRTAVLDHDRQRRGARNMLVVLHFLAQPVEHRQDECGDSQEQGQPAKDEPEEQDARTHGRKDRGERRTRRMDAAWRLRPDGREASLARPRHRIRPHDQHGRQHDERQDPDRHQGDERAPVGNDELRREVEERVPEVVEGLDHAGILAGTAVEPARRAGSV